MPSIKFVHEGQGQDTTVFVNTKADLDAARALIDAWAKDLPEPPAVEAAEEAAEPSKVSSAAGEV